MFLIRDFGPVSDAAIGFLSGRDAALWCTLYTVSNVGTQSMAGVHIAAGSNF